MHKNAEDGLNEGNLNEKNMHEMLSKAEQCALVLSNNKGTFSFYSTI